MKKILSFALALCILVSLCACGSQPASSQPAASQPASQPAANAGDASPASESETEKAPETKAPVSISMCTADVGSTNYGYGAIVCDLVTEKSDWVTMTAQASAGMGENVRLVGNQEADFGIVSTSGAYEGLTATGYYSGETPYEDMRCVCVLLIGYNLMLARDGIDSWYDLVGKTVGLGTAGSNIETNALAVLKGMDLYDKVNCVNLGFDDCVQLMVDGEMDAYMSGTAPFPSAINLASQMSVHPLPVPDDAFESIAKVSKCFKYVCPAGAYGIYDWMTEDCTTIGYAAYLVANKNVPDDVVYEVLSSLINDESLKYLGVQLTAWQFSEAANRIANPAEIEAAGLKLHDGAIKFWEDYGVTVPDSIR